MKNSYIAIAIIFLVAVTAGGLWIMNGFKEAAEVSEVPVTAERQTACENFLTVALFPDDGSAERFLEACLRGDPVLPGEQNEEGEVIAPPLVENPPVEPQVAPGCAVGGCSSQICGEEGEVEGVVTTCEWRSEYACYVESRCERQASGQCGWTETAEYTQCMKNIEAEQLVY